MTKQRVIEQAVVMAVAGMGGLVALLVAFGPLRSGALGAIVVGGVVITVLALAIDLIVFHKKPWAELTLRPFRYSTPNFVGILAAFLIFSAIGGRDSDDRAVIGFVVGYVVVVVGSLASNWWWASAAQPKPGDSGA